jgi:Kef-type K+ transport system membrane component KefB
MAVALGVILLKLAALLVAAKIAGEIAERLRQPSVIGELLVGALLGPSLFGFVDLGAAGQETTIIVFVATFGSILLLFEVGLETKFSEMVRVGPSALLVALLGVVSAFGAGYATSWALARFGLWPDAAVLHVFVGATLTATSVGITARVLSDMGRLATAEARVILGAAVLDDVAGLLILAVMSALAAGALDAWSIVKQGAIALGFLAAVIAIGIPLAPRALDFLSRFRSRGILVAVTSAFALLMAYLAEIVHLAAIVGAFAAGIVLAQTRQQHVIAERVRTLADIFVPFFFVYVGLQVDLRGLGDGGIGATIAILALCVAAVLGKLLAGLGVLERQTSRWAVGVGMVPRGEVGLIFALVGLTTTVGGAPLLPPLEYTVVIVVVAATTLITPAWLARVFRAMPAKPA